MAIVMDFAQRELGNHLVRNECGRFCDDSRNINMTRFNRDHLVNWFDTCECRIRALEHIGILRGVFRLLLPLWATFFRPCNFFVIHG